MDEDISIINSNTRNEKIKNFIFQNKKKIIIFVIFFIVILLSYFGYNELKNQKKVEISDLYNSVIINYSKQNKDETKINLVKIIKKKDTTYSPLSLYFIIDNNLILERQKVNELFDILIEKTPLEYEIKNLIIYKKALYNSDYIKENELLKILGPIINSESVWKSHSLYLIAEYFYSKNEKQKSKEFFEKILSNKFVNDDIFKEAKKRLNRDLSD